MLAFVDAPCGFQAPLQRFTIELIARVSLYGRRFFWSDDWLWNWLDVTIVASSFVPCDMFCCHTFSSNVADDCRCGWKRLRFLEQTVWRTRRRACWFEGSHEFGVPHFWRHCWVRQTCPSLLYACDLTSMFLNHFTSGRDHHGYHGGAASSVRWIWRAQPNVRYNWDCLVCALGKLGGSLRTVGITVLRWVHAFRTL